MDIERQVRAHCEELLKEKGHYEFKLYLKRIKFKTNVEDLTTIYTVLKEYSKKYRVPPLHH